MSEHRPRIMILGSGLPVEETASAHLEASFDIERLDEVTLAIDALKRGQFDAVFAAVGDFLPLERALVEDRASLVLNTIGEGVLVVDRQGRSSWCNKKMRTFRPDVFEQAKRIGLQALTIFSSQASPVPEGAGQPRSKKFTFQVGEQYFEMICSGVPDEEGHVRQVVGVVWDATSGRRIQGKIDAIDASGRELSRIDRESVTKLSPPERLKLLQDKIIKYSKDLMHFDHFAIRLLDRRSNKLEVVIAEGLPSDALQIDLYAQPEGNGISGYVASTGRSYICHDTEKDPRYVVGLEHCMSSLTVPLMLDDRVIGVYNVESETVGAFTEDDRQFAEIFARPVAQALHMLDLLLVERCTTSGQVADSVVQGLAVPLNDVVTEAQTLMEEYIGDDTMRERLGRIIEHVQEMRNSIKQAAAGPGVVLESSDGREVAVDPELSAKRVLVADDERNIRETIKEILTRQGCAVEVCKDGYEACCRLEQQKFDLVVSDIRMPYRNGYEIFAAAQREQEGLPVVLMTGFGYDPHHSIVRASQEGLTSVMFKPFKVDQLLEEVRKALGVTGESASAKADESRA
ncbi:response regulator [Mucisphaera calidilacus]|uniref:Transcriptional regulatory protein QseF n=1 Tax=Mucisphaera calidilacus TaxID=2527982 RepID=A0A518BXT7_9BACT|nr:response regulator [Mucisphaera calidilacus]QDU71780.1 Transcriptional regulatory protein QseF [Mucisphaera calidilacus]